MIRLFFFLVLMSMMSCKKDKSGSMLDIEKKDEFIPKSGVTVNIGRSSWQKPDLVINKLGDISGKKIADIGAGTGYFSYRLAFKGADVLALDVDEDMISLMNGFKANLPTEVAKRIETKLVKTDDPLLKKEEVDIAIIINTIGYIEDKIDYLSILKEGIKPGGSILIVDYKTRELNIPAPPMNQRVAIGMIQESLKAAGYSKILVDDTSLDYQYMVMAGVNMTK